MIVLVLASPARSSAAPSASLMSGFAEGTRLGEASTLSATLKLTGNEYHGEPLPLSQVTLRMPKGTVLSNAGFPTCATSAFNHYPLECPTGSRVWSDGVLTAFIAFGPEYVEEQGGIEIYADPEGGVSVLLVGHYPAGFEVIVHGEYLPAEGGSGPGLRFSVPAIETVRGGPIGSITSLTIPLGAFHEHEGATAANVTAPTECTTDLTWSVSAKLSDDKGTEATANAETTSVCPGAGKRTATTTELLASPTVLENEPEVVTARVAPKTPAGAVPSGGFGFNIFNLFGVPGSPLMLAPNGSDGEVSEVVETSEPGEYVVAGGFYLGDANFAPSEATVPVAFRVLERNSEEEAANKRKLEAEAAAKKKAEEQAVAKKASEEAQAKKAAEEATVKRKAEERSATVKIDKVKVSTGRILVTVKLTYAGTVTVTGPGLKKTVVSLAAGTHQIAVALTAAGKTERKHGKTIKLAVSLKLSANTVAGSEKVKL